MTFLELCQRTHAEAGLAGSGPTSPLGQSGMNAKVVNWVRDAWNDIQQMHNDWNFLWKSSNVTLLAGSRSYTPVAAGVADLNIIDRAVVSFGTAATEVELIPLPWDEFNASFRLQTVATGTAEYMSITASRKC